MRSERAKYAPFAAALQAGTEKLEKYYDKTGNLDTYIVSMCTFLYQHHRDLLSLNPNLDCITSHRSCTKREGKTFQEALDVRPSEGGSTADGKVGTYFLASLRYESLDRMFY